MSISAIGVPTRDKHGAYCIIHVLLCVHEENGRNSVSECITLFCLSFETMVWFGYKQYDTKNIVVTSMMQHAVTYAINAN